jgi:serralysin
MGLFNTNGTHLYVCSCPSCAGSSSSAQGAKPLFGDANKVATSADELAVAGGTAGYIQGLTGSNAIFWANGGPGTEVFGQAANVIYTYANGVSWANSAGNSGGTLYTADRQAAMNNAMQDMSNLANITFTLGTAATAQMAFKSYNLAGAAGVAYTQYFMSGSIFRTEVVLDNNVASFGAASEAQAFAMGGYGRVSAYHELGHGVGLKHPGNYNAGGGGAAGPYLTDFGYVDSRDCSLMSYYDGTTADAWHRPTGFMIFDVATLQFLYGAKTSYNSGNTTYTLTTNTGVYARWDGGGIDTLDASAEGSAVTIDLREGVNNWTIVGNSRTQNAFNSNFENANGGGGADTITGNGLANTVNGHHGRHRCRQPHRRPGQ